VATLGDTFSWPSLFLKGEGGFSWPFPFPLMALVASVESALVGLSNRKTPIFVGIKDQRKLRRNQGSGMLNITSHL